MGQLGVIYRPPSMREVTRLLPSLAVGEYAPPAVLPRGGLFPLQEEGSYGELPKVKTRGKWKLPQPYVPREKKPKVYASYNICECCVQGQEVERRGTSVSSRRNNLSRNERAASAPPQTTTSIKKQVKFVKRIVSEPAKNTAEEELGLLNRLKLSKEVKQDTIESLRVDC